MDEAPQEAKTYRIIDTPKLIEINRRSKRHNYNRTLSVETVLMLDPDGTHIQGSIVIPHEHAQGIKVDLHWRVQLLVKLIGQTEAVDLFLDMTQRDYDSLTKIEKNERGDWVEVAA